MRFSYWTEKLRQRMAGLSRRRRVPHANPQAERCEERCLPSVSALLFTDSFNPALQDLTILCDGPDDISVSVSGGNIQILVGQNGGVQTTLLGQPTVAPGLLARIDIFGSDATNRIALNGVTTANGYSASLIVTADAGDSNDLLDATSSDIAVSLVGGNGADTITGGAANDTLLGGDGADLITGGVGNDSLLGGNGADTVNAGVGLDTLNGGDGADSLNGGDDNDNIFAGNGADNIDGGLGDDTLNGDGGNDTINGNTGNDTIFGGADQDSLLGGDGNDSINAQAGNDTVNGELGDDSLDGGDGNDSVLGGAGNDVVNGSANNDTLFGETGNDVMFGGSGDDSMDGGGGNDTVSGQAGNDTVLGGGGSDSVDGGAGNDIVQSQPANAAAPLPSISITDGIVGEGAPPLLFNTAVSYPVGAGGGAANAFEAMTANDFNGDGFVDVAVTVTSGTVRLMLNNGNGTYRQGATLTAGTSPRGITSADFDGDGDIDIAATNSFGLANTNMSVFMNNGNGTFAPAINLVLPSFSFPLGVVAADVTGDGRPELITANAVGNTISVFTNNGSGAFGPRNDYAAGAGATDLVAVDLNGDGQLDIAVADANANQVTVLTNNAGTFGTSTTFAVGTRPVSITAFDLDNDGDRDLAVGCQGNNEITVLANNGTGTLTVSARLTTSGSIGNLHVVAFDIEGDSDADLAVANSSGNSQVNVFVNGGGGVFGARQNINLPNPGDTGGPLAARDANGDGAPDLLIAGLTGDLLQVLINQNPAFSIPTATLTVSLSQPSAQTVTVKYATADGSATAASGDYNSTSGTLTFAPGQTTQTITVSPKRDALVEPTENFFVNLSAPTNATISDSQSHIALFDGNGGIPGPTLSITSTTVVEGTGGTTNAVLTVRLSAVSNQSITVGYSTGDGTAIAGSDYSAVNNTLTFAPGTTTQTITVPVNGDSQTESTETFFVNLYNPVNVVLATSRGTITITDDDLFTVDFPTLLGGVGDDTILGGTADELINGGAGNDSIDAGAGNDTVFGGAGNDTINGGSGNDTINGQGGNDNVDGGAGDDQIVWTGASGASDTIAGTSGFDTAVVNGTGSADTLAVGQDSSGQMTVTDSGFPQATA